MKSEWKKNRLGELYEVHNGLSKGRKFFGRGYPFLSFSTVFNRYFLPDKLTDLVDSTEKERETLSIRRGDVFITRTSETYDELGMSCVALKDYPNATFNGFTKRLRPIETGRVLPEYIGYFLRGPQFRRKFEQIANVTTRASLSNGDLLNMEVSLPSLPVQQKIASILSTLDDKIETNNAICRNLEEQACALFKSWFIDFEPFKNQEFTDSEMGLVPIEWTVKKLGSLANVVSGKRPKTKISEMDKQCNIPILGASGIMGYTNESMYRSKKILVIGRVGTLGIVQRFEKDCWPSDNALVIQSIYYEYINQILTRFDYLAINRGSTQPLITQTDIKNINVIIPPQHILNKFESRIGELMKLHSKLKEEENKLVEIRQTLLPKLMKGELVVNNVEL